MWGLRQRRGRGHKPSELHKPWSPQTLDEAGNILPWSLGRDRGPADTLTLDSWHLELRDMRSLWLEVCSHLLRQLPHPGPYGHQPTWLSLRPHASCGCRHGCTCHLWRPSEEQCISNHRALGPTPA